MKKGSWWTLFHHSLRWRVAPRQGARPRYRMTVFMAQNFSTSRAAAAATWRRRAALVENTA